jgi:hypothetical protein
VLRRNELGQFGFERLALRGREQAIPQLGAQFLDGVDDHEGVSD